MSDPEAHALPRYTCADETHGFTWDDGYRVELVQPSVHYGRLYGVRQACHGDNILNVVDGNLLDDGARQRFADACQRANGQVAWLPRLLYATNTVNTALRGTAASAAAVWNTRETLAVFLVQLGGNMYSVLQAVSHRKTRLSTAPNWRGMCGTQY